MSYDPRGQNYEACEANVRATRNVERTSNVYDPYPVSNAWKWIRRALLVVLVVGVVLAVGFTAAKADTSSLQLQMSYTLGK